MQKGKTHHMTLSTYQALVSLGFEWDHPALRKTVERACRDIAIQGMQCSWGYSRKPPRKLANLGRYGIQYKLHLQREDIAYDALQLRWKRLGFE
jgi:hypothetical protein